MCLKSHKSFVVYQSLGLLVPRATFVHWVVPNIQIVEIQLFASVGILLLSHPQAWWQGYEDKLQQKTLRFPTTSSAISTHWDPTVGQVLERASTFAS